jgi:hypothetical protein
MLIISHNKHARKCQGLYVLIISQLNESRTNNQLNHHLTHIHQAKHSYHYGRNPEDITVWGSAWAIKHYVAGIKCQII